MIAYSTAEKWSCHLPDHGLLRLNDVSLLAGRGPHVLVPPAYSLLVGAAIVKTSWAKRRSPNNCCNTNFVPFSFLGILTSENGRGPYIPFKETQITSLTSHVQPCEPPPCPVNQIRRWTVWTGRNSTCTLGGWTHHDASSGNRGGTCLQRPPRHRCTTPWAKSSRHWNHWIIHKLGNRGNPWPTLFYRHEAVSPTAI